MLFDWVKGTVSHWQDSVWLKRLPTAVTLLLFILLAYNTAALTWRVLPSPLSDEALPGTEVVPQATALPPVTALARQISQWHLFGEARPDQPPVVAQQAQTAPETQLNLKLMGVFAASEQSAARAIIADTRGQEDSYAIGEEVASGVKLNLIFKDRVLLERNGRLETLRLPETANTQSGSDVGNEAVAAIPEDEAPPQEAVVGANADRAELLKQYRAQLLSDPQSVMGLVRADPFNRDGKLVGWRLRPGRDRQLLQRFGLRSGDVVTSVNGVSMDNPVRGLEVLRDLSSATQLNLVIERDGSSQALTFQVD